MFSLIGSVAQGFESVRLIIDWSRVRIPPLPPRFKTPESNNCFQVFLFGLFFKIQFFFNQQNKYIPLNIKDNFSLINYLLNIAYLTIKQCNIEQQFTLYYNLY